MKRIAVCGFIVALLCNAVLAIPQTVGITGTLGASGRPFEQIVADPKSWDGNDALEGHWALQGDTMTLTDSTAVFGVATDEVTAQRQDGHITGFRVVFRATDKKHPSGKSSDVLAQLKTNIRAFTGDQGSGKDSGVTTFKYKTVTITLHSGADRSVVVEFTRG